MRCAPRRDQRRKAVKLRLPDHLRPAAGAHALQTHGLPHVPIDRSGVGQPRSHCLGHVAVAVGEERPLQVAPRQDARRGELALGHQPARIGQGIGVGEDLAPQVGPLRHGRLLPRVRPGADQVRLVGRLPLVKRHGEQSQIGLVAHVGIAADPGRVQLACEQQVQDRLVRIADREHHTGANALRQVVRPARQEGRLVGQDHGRQADPQSLGLRIGEACKGCRAGGACGSQEQLASQLSPPSSVTFS
jgi:hypothetical protein